MVYYILLGLTLYFVLGYGVLRSVNSGKTHREVFPDMSTLLFGMAVWLFGSYLVVTFYIVDKINRVFERNEGC